MDDILKKRRHVPVLILLADVLAAGGASVGGASAAETTTMTEFDPVVITATRTGIHASDAPASVSVITRDEIERKTVGRVGDALSGTTGLFLRGSAFGDVSPGGSTGTVTMRGVSGSSRTLITMDGQTLNSPYSGSVDYSALDIDEIDHIEVVPGAFSSLYGGSAFAGVVNAVTKAPDKRETILKAGIGGASDQYFMQTGSALYRDRIGRVGVSVGVAGTNSSGYEDDFGTGKPPAAAVGGATTIPTTTGGTTSLLGQKGKKPWDQERGHLTLFLDPSDATTLSLGVSRSQERVGYSAPRSYLVDRSGNPVFSTSLLTYTPSSESVTRVFLRSETDLAPQVKLKTDASYSEFGYWYVSPNLTYATANGGRGTFFDAPSTRIDGTLQVDAGLGSWNTLTVGVNAKQEDFRRRNYDLSNFHDEDSKGAKNYQAEGTSNTVAGFIQDRMDLTSRLAAYIGGRYDYFVAQGSTQQWKTPEQSAPGFRNSYGPRWDSAFSPKASLVYKPVDGLTLRASGGTAFRPPGLIDMYTKQVTSTSTTSPDPTLKPETVTSWEAGGDLRLPTETTVKVTLFENHMRDLIYTQTLSPTQKLKINAGRAMSQGVEMGVEQRALQGLTLFANATYTHSKMQENAAAPSSVGQRLTYVPLWMANFGVDGEIDRWSGSLTGRYVGKVFATDGNTDVAQGSYGMYDPYVTVDAKIAYEVLDGTKVSVAVGNLFDHGYYQYYRMPGRTFFGELSVRF